MACPTHRFVLAAVAALCLGTPAWAIVGGTPTTAFGVVGDGVQIAPNWVLTASHVALDVGSSYANGYGSARVDAVYLAPGAGFPDHDLKLVHLSSAIGATPVLPLSSVAFSPTALDWNAPSLDIAVTIATNSTQSPRGFAHAQLREFAHEFMDDHDNDPATPDVLRTVDWLITHQNGLGAPYVQGGDSGGGLFLGHVADATTPLLGITSALIDRIAGADTFASGFVSVASYRGWIDATMAADLSDTQLPLWATTPVPEPATAALAAAGGLLLAARARRRLRVPTTT